MQVAVVCIRLVTVSFRLFPYSSREPSELSQWLCYDDSTVNIVVVIIIIIIIIVIIVNTLIFVLFLKYCMLPLLCQYKLEYT